MPTDWRDNIKQSIKRNGINGVAADWIGEGRNRTEQLERLCEVLEAQTVLLERQLAKLNRTRWTACRSW